MLITLVRYGIDPDDGGDTSEGFLAVLPEGEYQTPYVAGEDHPSIHFAHALIERIGEWTVLGPEKWQAGMASIEVTEGELRAIRTLWEFEVSRDDRDPEMVRLVKRAIGESPL